MSIDTLSTERLTLERMSMEHLDDLTRMWTDTTVGASLGGVRTADNVAQWMTTNVAHWDQHNFGFWAARDRETGEFVGYVGLWYRRIGDENEVELAYGLLPAYWGRGLATEMAEAALTTADLMLGIHDVVALVLPSNAPSRRIIEKCGFRYEREVPHAGLTHMLYRHRVAATE